MKSFAAAINFPLAHSNLRKEESHIAEKGRLFKVKMFTQNKTLGKCLLFSHFIGLFNRNSRKKGPRSRLQKTVQKSRYSTILQDFDNNTTTAIVLAFYTSQKRLLSFLTTPTYYLGGECYYSMPSCHKKWQYNGKHLGQTTNALTLQ